MNDQQSSDPPIRETSEDASAGEKRGHMRYVLLISLVLAVGALSAIVWLPLLFSK